MAKTVIDPGKPIPTPEDVSAELRELLARDAVIGAEADAVDKERREIGLITAAEQYADDRKGAIDALVKGSSYSPSIDIRDRTATLVKRAAILKDARHEVSVLIKAARHDASRLVVAEFRPEQLQMAKEFFAHIAAAAKVHAAFGAMRMRIERAGFDSGGLHDFGRDLMGVPGKKADPAGFALRDGIRRGYIADSAVPEEYR